MARLVSKLSNTASTELTDAQRAAANRRIRSATKSNPLRRVLLECHGWVRDPLAAKGDFVWCGECADWAKAVDVAE